MSTNLRILLIEDSEDDARLILREIQRGGVEAQTLAYDHLLSPSIGGACVPLHTENRIVSVVFIDVAQPRELTAGKIRMLTALAEMGGNSIHPARPGDRGAYPASHRHDPETGTQNGAE